MDIDFYVDPQVQATRDVLDVPVANGEIVSINLKDDLPEDAAEIVSFLETEKGAKKYWLSIASGYMRMGDSTAAVQVVESAVKLSLFSAEEVSDLHVYLAFVYLQLADSLQEKISNLQQAEAQIQLAQHGAVQNVALPMAQAIIFLKREQYDQASEIFDKLVQIRPDNCFALLGKAQIILTKSQNYRAALKIYQQVLMLNPLMKPDPRLGVGICFWLLKDETMAIKSFERALEMDPTNEKAQLLLLLTKYNSALTNSLSDEEFITAYTDCVEQTSKLYQKSSTNPVVLLALAAYYFAREEYDIVQTIASSIVQSMAGNVKARASQTFKFENIILSQCSMWLGNVQFVMGEFAQAQKHFNESIKFDDKNLMAKLGLAQAQIRRGSTEEATITLESILKTNPKSLEVIYTLAMIYSTHKSSRKRELAIAHLEKYLRLANERGLESSDADQKSRLSSKEPVALNAYLVLSRLYESKDLVQSLNFLKKAVESRQLYDLKAPLEVYNNIGVMNFLKNNHEAAIVSFNEALAVWDSKEYKDLGVILNYNLARTEESQNLEASIEKYKLIVEETPSYLSAKLRLLFLECVSQRNNNISEIKQDFDELIQNNPANLEVRSLFGWFIKNFGKKIDVPPDADTNHHKETLVDYQSHDCYALIALANIYCIMAREIKGDDKKKKYYIRAIELFSKVLSIDPKNSYAAQGLAIFYIENKELDTGLDILRKIRDSLDDISVYLNLGHVLAEKKQYSKAIENYEIALHRYTDGKDSRILSLLGRTWMLRGISEKNVDYLQKALELTQEALENGGGSSVKFNVSYVQYQNAELVTKLPLEERSITDIEQALEMLAEAIESLNKLADEKHPPYPSADLKARANLGQNALMNRLTACLEETKASVSELDLKLEQAKQLREEEQQQRLKDLEEQALQRQLKEEELAKARAVLQEEASKWAEENAKVEIVDDELDEKLFNEESAAKKEKKEKKEKKPKKKANKRKRNVVQSDESDLEQSAAPSPKMKKLSNERIEDSDEELDGLFDDE